MLGNYFGHLLRGSIPLSIFVLGLGLLLSPAPAFAAINPQINFQGKFTNPDGTNVTNGTYSVRFRIYSDPTLDAANVCAANTCKWEETQGSVSLTDGIFRVALGSSTALPGSVDFNSGSLYLGVKVGSDAEMTPRITFTSSPYAFNSNLLGGISSTGFAQLGVAAAQTDSSTNSTLFLNKTAAGSIIQLQSTGVDVLNVLNNGSLVFGQNADKTISIVQTTTNTAGKSLSLTAGQGGAGASANAGGDLNLQGGTGGGTNGNGGAVVLSGGAANGTGSSGGVTVKNAADSTTAFQVLNAAGTTSVLSVDTVNNVVNITNGLVIATNDSSIVRSSTAEFALGTVGASLQNANGQLELSDGTIPNVGTGTFTTAGQPAVDAAIGAGASAVTRPDGKYLVIKGGSTLATSLYDSIVGSFTNSQTLVTGAGTVGVGSLLLPRTSGMYVVVLGNGVVNTSNLDPSGVVLSTAGPSLTAAANAGTVALKRADGKYLVTLGGGAGITNIYDPVANTFVAGPTNAGAVTWGVGALSVPRPDGSALIVAGGNTSSTQIYNPSTANPSIGVFSSVGPSMDGNQAAGTCGINNLGSVAVRRADGKYLILSKAGVSTLYDPVASTFTCRSTNGPAGALGNGAHAIPLQDGKFLIVRGGATTNAYVYDPTSDAFTVHGTTLTSVSAGAFSVMRANGTWQIMAGVGTATMNYDTGLPMNGAATKYTSDDISTNSLNQSSLLKWTAQFESAFQGTNAAANTAFSTVQFFVRTAVNSSGCTAPLNAATDREVSASGDFIRPGFADNCIRLSVQFNRPIPKRIIDERGTWTGNSSTILRLDYVTPSLFDLMIDNSTVLHRDAFSFTAPFAQQNNNGTIPTALTSNAPSAGGACSAGTHFWFVSFVTNTAESRLSTASGVQTCTAGNGTVSLTTVPVGPIGTTARKIYRTPATNLATDTPFLLTTISDNVTTTFSDTVADTALGAAYAQTDASGPVTTRVEAVNGQLTLPFGRITPTTQAGTTQYYLGNTTAAHVSLTQAQTNTSTIVLVRSNKTYVVIAALTAPAANASLYDPATQTFTAQAGTSIPTAANGIGGFAVKRPDGKYLVVLGNSTTATNMYDPDTNTFSNGPVLSGVTASGASVIQNSDGSFTIVHGGGLTTSTLYDPVRNTMSTGPTLSTAANCGFWALPLQNGMYKTFVGVASGVVGVTTSMNYNPISKTFVAGTALAAAHGCGSFALQRPDGFWLSVGAAGGAGGASSTVTTLINPVDGTTVAGPAITTTGVGATLIPRADGTFLILSGSASATSSIYIPYGGTFGVGAGIGTAATGPTLAAVTGAGSVTFQRSDGKWVIINGNATQTTQLADVGWYADGQYLSEQMQVPALARNSVLNWSQSDDDFIRMEARTAASQATLAAANYNSVGRPGTSINNAGGETWVQIEVNFRREFPTFGGVLSGVYVSGGGMVYPMRSIAQPSLQSYSLNNGSDLLTLQNDGLSVFRIGNDGSVYTSAQGGFYSGGADLAENYTSRQSLVAGEVVSIDSTDNHSVKRSANQYQQDILGVVSTAPGFVAGAYTEDSYPVALVGRVPVKISNENGMVREGDYLTAGSIPGYAMKATVSGRVLGMALESFTDSSTKTICPTTGAGAAGETVCGSVTMFVNLTNYDGASIETLMDQQPDGQLMGDAIIPNVQFPEINGFTGAKETKVLSFLKDLKARQALGTSPTGGSILTNKVNAVTEVISPLIVADIIRANTIQASKIEGLEVFTDKISSLSSAYDGLQNQIGQSVTTTTALTDLKNAQFESGTFSLSLVSLGVMEAKGGIVVDGDAQFNGKVTFATLAQFLGAADFKGNVSIGGSVTFNNDGGGTAIIKKDAPRVTIQFQTPYALRPIVSATPSIAEALDANLVPTDQTAKELLFLNGGYSYIVSNISNKGFTIVLNKKATEDIEFNWNAAMVKDARTAVSDTVAADIPASPIVTTETQP